MADTSAPGGSQSQSSPSSQNSQSQSSQSQSSQSLHESASLASDGTSVDAQTEAESKPEESKPEENKPEESKPEADLKRTQDDSATTTAPNDDNSDDEPPAKKRSLCGVCGVEPSKYKCPRCAMGYCSVACNRVHRDNHPPDAPKPVSASAPQTQTQAQTPPQPAEAAPPTHPFQVLDDAPELRHLFATYPRLPARLRAIADATLPPRPPSATVPGLPPRPFQAQGQGHFGHGRGRGGFGGRSKAPQPWTKELGLVQGQKALRRARVDPGEDGDAVRAYCELVTHLLARGRPSPSGPGASVGADAAKTDAVLQAELAAERAESIKQLHNHAQRH